VLKFIVGAVQNSDKYKNWLLVKDNWKTNLYIWLSGETNCRAFAKRDFPYQG